MTNPGSEPRLLGFLISPGADEYLLSVDKMTVLYGLNGAGKSTALRLVRSLFSGERVAGTVFGQGPIGALVRLGDSRSLGNESWFSTRNEIRRNGYAPVPVDLEEALSEWVNGSLVDQFASSPGRPPMPEDLPRRREALLAEWKKQRLVLIHSMDGYWVSWPALVTSPSTPAANAEVARVEDVLSNDGRPRDPEFLISIQGRTAEGGTVVGLAGAGNRPTEFPRMGGVAYHLRLPNIGVRLALEAHDPGRETVHRLEWWSDQLDEELFDYTERGAVLSRPLAEMLRKVEQAANANYAAVLRDAPELHVHVSTSGFYGGIGWSAVSESLDGVGRMRAVGRSLDELSSAEGHWAYWAINAAIAQHLPHINDSSTEWDDRWAPDDPPGELLTIIDEPERALHRSAESQMVSFLTSTASPRNRFLVATHSPELLNPQDQLVVEVRRGPPARIQPLTHDMRASLDDLGLTPSDLLRSQRGFLLVEGQHDLDVIDVLLGDELRRLRVDVLPLRGATQLSAAHARFLFDYTSAHVFVVLDNLKSELIAQTWERVCEMRVMAGVDASRDALVTALTPKTMGKDTEVRVLTEFLSACLDGSDWSRVTPIGLSRGDVIEYLPVRDLVDGSRDWKELRQRFEDDLAQNSGGPKNFKAWLRGHGGRVTDEAVRQAARSMDELPQDFARLHKAIEASITAS